MPPFAKLKQHVRDVMDKLYTPNPDGYCGDEDNGQTSAWYVFSALGFYPVCPASNQYVIGSPLFEKAVLSFQNGNKLTIYAHDNNNKNIYVKELNFNGKIWDKNYLNHDDLFKGGELRFKMSPVPDFKRGISEKAYPYSMN